MVPKLQPMVSRFAHSRGRLRRAPFLARREIPAPLLPTAVPLLCALTLLALAAGLFESPGAATPTASAQGGVDVDVVVDFGDGRVEVAHVDAISGTTALEALWATGLEVVTRPGGIGLAVCAVGGVGCPADDCFCACPGEDCRFWGVQQGDGEGGWTPLEVGASEYVLPEEGAPIGFVWGRPAPMAWSRERLSAMAAWPWLRGQLQPDGGLYDPGLTLDGLLAARAVQADVVSWRADEGEAGPLDHLRSSRDDYAAQGAAQAGKLLAGLAATDEATPEELAAARSGTLGFLDDASGRFGGSTWAQGWAILGLASSGVPVDPAAVAALEAGAVAGGGWGDLLGAESASVDATGLALVALGAAGVSSSEAVSAALAWLEQARQPDGGWGTDAAGPSNVNSTAMAIYGLDAVRVDPREGPWTIHPLPSADDEVASGPLLYLRDTQDPEGFYLHAPEASALLATLQAMPAMTGRAPLLPGGSVTRERAVAAVLAARQPDGGFAVGLLDPPAATSIDALLALHGAGVDPEMGRPEEQDSVLGYLNSVGPGYGAAGGEAAGRVLMATLALGEDPRGGGALTFDALALLAGHLDVPSGRFAGGTPADQAWGIRAWSAAGQAVPEAMVEVLVEMAGERGWGLDVGAEVPLVESTALALEALLAGGRGPEDRDVRQAIAWLRAFQEDSGLFRGLFDQPSAGATGLALRALVAAGQHVDGPGWARSVDGRRWTTPREALFALQVEDGRFPGPLGEADEGTTYLALHGLAAYTPYLAPERSSGRVWLPLLLRPR